MPPPRFGHGFSNDIFISYARVDDAPDTEGRKWVSQFADDLVHRLEMVSGHTIKVWRDNRLDAADVIDAAIDAELGASAILVPILSPAYFASTPCRIEREHFLERAGAESTGATKTCVVKVAKTRVNLSRYPAELAATLEHRFYKEESNGSYKEFHMHERPDVRALYATVVDDVAQELSRLLAAFEGRPPADAPRTTIFLAQATGDVDAERTELRRFFEHMGCEVLPSKTLPLEADSLERDVGQALQAASLAVFVVGSRYGWVPDMGEGRSFVRLQLEYAAQHAARLPRLVWIPSGVKATEPTQGDLLDLVRRELPARGFEVIETNGQAFQTHLRDRLRPKPPQKAVPSSETGSADLRLYLMVDRCDRDSARPLRQQLLAAGLGVDWLPGSGEAATIGQLHREWLLHDDAVLIFYGASDEAWLACQQLELRKAAGHGRRTQPKTRIVLAAPPSADKEDLRLSRGLVLDGLPPKELKEALVSFISELATARVTTPRAERQAATGV